MGKTNRDGNKRDKNYSKKNKLKAYNKGKSKKEKSKEIHKGIIQYEENDYEDWS